MKVRDIIKQLQNEGWYLVRQSGSHKIFKHKNKPDVRIVLPDHGKNKEPSPGVLNDIKKKLVGNNKLILVMEYLVIFEKRQMELSGQECRI